ncbi:hypothetical protein FB45DRAFT_910201 [Roridomyces roridus]|uniref:Uncharacterized protein n=1 Tax=Roridomyces roridus TaxID=1738132 RepID=A0AAD7BZL4_9AGAR|nr:hypothetical protein FB45DRAFT_910201 [Roridomyces roridus]
MPLSKVSPPERLVTLLAPLSKSHSVLRQPSFRTPAPSVRSAQGPYSASSSRYACFLVHSALFSCAAENDDYEPFAASVFLTRVRFYISLTCVSELVRQRHRKSIFCPALASQDSLHRRRQRALNLPSRPARAQPRPQARRSLPRHPCYFPPRARRALAQMSMPFIRGSTRYWRRTAFWLHWRSGRLRGPICPLRRICIM